jgi:asparagine synthetase B (glutamine-hydrolysing)
MCGIFGLIDNNRKKRDEFSKDIEKLFKLSETRGKEAAGVAIETKSIIDVYKDSIPASEMIKSNRYKRFISDNIDRLDEEYPSTLIGHTRLVTNGLQTIEANNQPIKKNGMVVVHNGIITNEAEIWRENETLEKQSEVDSELFPTLIDKYLKEKDSLLYAVKKTFQKIKGEASIAILFDKLDIMLLATNTGSLYTITENNKKVFVSEEYIAKQIISGKNSISAFSNSAKIKQIKAGEVEIIDLDTLDSKNYKIKDSYASINFAPLLSSQKKIEDKYEKDEHRRENLKRCTRCILPETMPFIEFDNDGVCNFCKNHKPKILLGRDKLEEELDKYRSKDGSADCLVAFSGGRDSSYGLHIIKEEFNMNPIAYTYDWGMVTDIARRNQARMCGQLGVEHLWVSADIKQKRKNIQKNVKAWMKKPDLGMIPLFMAGDKQFFWYANKTIEQTGIKLMVFSQNHFEKTDFKTGFAGQVPNLRNDSKFYHIPLKNKLAMPLYYGKNFLLNPYYINDSIFDTLWAYASYYFIKQDYLYLFDYIEWDEDRLNDTLLSNYDWEIATDTTTTWRIGDATAPFYNYIYYIVTGFSENDTFRSNQIREGVLTRERALELSQIENRPRWQSIREYLQMIDVSFDDSIKTIDRIGKLY